MKKEIIKIRAAKPVDAKGMGILMKGMLKAKKAPFIGSNTMPKDKIIKWRKNILSKKSNIFVAEANKKIIGNVSFKALGERLRKTATMGWIVSPDYQNKGIATKLLGKAIQKARQLKLKRLECHIVPENRVSIKLVEKFGFKKEGTLKKAFLTDDGKYLDLYCYGKILS